MVKRQADKQLTDRNCDDSDHEETPPNGTMKTASPQVLGRRQIRALPGRNGKTTTSTGLPKPLAPSSNAPLASSPFGHASQPGKPAFTSLLAGSKNFDTNKTSPFGPTSVMLSKPNSNFEQSKPKNVEALTNYYASLRGLNLSVLKALEDLTQKDAFMDLSKTFDHIKAKYDQYRSQIQSELDLVASSTTQKDQVHSSSTDSIPATIAPFSSPANGINKASKDNSVSANSSPSQTQLQVPSGDNNSKTSQNGSIAHDSKTVPTRSPFAAAAPARPSPLRYENENVPAGSPTPEVPDPTSETKSNSVSIPEGKVAPFLFSTASTADHKSLFSTRSTNDQNPKFEAESADSSTAPLPVSTNVENKSAFLFGTPPTSSGSTSVFGTAAPKPFSFVSAQMSSSVNKSPNIPFGFGASGTNASAFGGFGATKNSTTQATPPKNGFNPVGFSFGNSPPTSSALLDKPATSEKETHTNNSTSSSNDANNAAGGKSKAQDENSDAPLTTEQLPGIAVSNKGEEEEETLYETNGRVYALMDKKQDDGKIAKGWVGWAVCNVKLNRHKETKKSRLLARSQVNQGILINFFLRPDLKPENRGTSLEVLGFDPEGTHLQAYRIRPPNEQVVEEFINTIKEVVKSL